MTKAEAYSRYKNANGQYNDYNNRYKFYGSQLETAQKRYAAKDRELSDQKKLLTTLKNRRSALDTVKNMLEGEVTDFIVKACGAAVNAGTAYVSAMVRSNGGGATAALGSVFRMKSVQEDGATNGALNDCKTERQKAQARIETAEDRIRSLQSEMATLQDTIRRSKNARNEAYNNRQYWARKRDEYWRLYKSL